MRSSKQFDLIYICEKLDLLHVKDFPLADLFTVDDTGIKLNQPDLSDLTIKELQALKDMELQLPCNEQELIAWAERNGFADFLKAEEEIPGSIKTHSGTQDQVINRISNPQNPCWTPDPKDPPANQLWYTPARYFAKRLIKENPGLLLKRKILAKKIVEEFDSLNIKKRGGVHSFDPATILKALSKVKLG